MNTKALMALKSLASPARPQPAPTPVPEVVRLRPQDTMPTVKSVEVVTNRNRIDVWFTDKPSESFRDILKASGWLFNGDRVCWYHKDTPENRRFLVDRFNLNELIQDAEYTYTHKTETESVTISNDSIDFVAAQFQRYTKQVDSLCEALKLDKVDLLYQAIGELYAKHFN